MEFLFDEFPENDKDWWQKIGMIQEEMSKLSSTEETFDWHNMNKK